MHIHCTRTCRNTFVVEVVYLLQDDSMPVELVSSGGSVLDLGRHSEPKRCQLPHLSQEGDQLVAVVHPQLAVTMTQLHETTTCLEPTEWKSIQYTLMKLIAGQELCQHAPVIKQD